jgi:GNAT superfamily N-acetyltransferase
MPIRPDEIDLTDVVVRKLDGPPDAGFDCGHEDQNAFLYTRAWDDQQQLVSTTYLYYVHGILAGYATICLDALELSRRERGWHIKHEIVGALKLAQLGVDQAFNGRGLGTYIVADVIELARGLSDTVGCRYLTVDARADMVSWYERRLGFKHNTEMQMNRIERAVRRQRDPERLAASMRFDLRES